MPVTEGLTAKTVRNNEGSQWNGSDIRNELVARGIKYAKSGSEARVPVLRELLATELEKGAAAADQRNEQTIQAGGETGAGAHARSHFSAGMNAR